jgi:hypothetical protein
VGTDRIPCSPSDAPRWPGFGAVYGAVYGAGVVVIAAIPAR